MPFGVFGDGRGDLLGDLPGVLGFGFRAAIGDCQQ